jgi:hypothetical protein
MRFARLFILFQGILFIGYGAYCLIYPEFIALTLNSNVTASAITEFRAMYGGLQLAIGMFLIYSLKSPQLLEGALALCLVAFACLSTSRGISMGLNETDHYNLIAFSYEFGSLMVNLYAFIKVRITLSGDQHLLNHAIIHHSASHDSNNHDSTAHQSKTHPSTAHQQSS